MNKINFKNIDIYSIIIQNNKLLTVKELLIIIGYNIDNIYLDKFWDSIEDDSKMIYLDDESILWMGYDDIRRAKDSICKILKRHFVNNEDFKIMNHNEYKDAKFIDAVSASINKEEEKRGIHNKQYIMLYTDCFKEICMYIGTSKSKEIKKYYIELEKIFKFYLEYQNQYQQLQTQKIQEKLQNKDNELNKNMINDQYKLNALLQALATKSVVYAGFIDEYTIKFGRSNDIQERIKTHIRTYGSFKIIYIKECNNNLLIENKIKQYAKENDILINRIINSKNYTELIKITDEFSINMLINKIEIECINLSKNNDELVIILQNENNKLKENIKKLEKDNEILNITNDILGNELYNIKHKVNIKTEVKDKVLTDIKKRVKQVSDTKESTKDSIEDNPKEKPQKKYNCTKCNNYSTNEKSDYEAHLNRVYKCDEIRKKKIYTCPKCNKDFQKPGNLEDHLNRKSSCTDILKCTKCDKVFTNIHNYNQHINKVESCI